MPGPEIFELHADIGKALHRPWRQRMKTVLRLEALVLLLVLSLQPCLLARSRRARE